MADLLKKAFDKAMTLPVDQQDAAGAALLDYLDDTRSLRLTDEQLAEVRRRLSDPARRLLSVQEVKDRLTRLG